MSHPVKKELARQWFGYLGRYDLLADRTGWCEAVSDDQTMLQELLAARPHAEPAVLPKSWDFLNSRPASFVRQVMRAPHETFEQRLQDIRTRVADVMAQA